MYIVSSKLKKSWNLNWFEHIGGNLSPRKKEGVGGWELGNRLWSDGEVGLPRTRRSEYEAGGRMGFTGFIWFIKVSAIETDFLYEN